MEVSKFCQKPTKYGQVMFCEAVKVDMENSKDSSFNHTMTSTFSLITVLFEDKASSRIGYSPWLTLGFCVLCVRRSDKYFGVVPGVQPMSSNLVTLANSRFMSMLLHNLNRAVVSSHMQSVVDSHSSPRTIVTCAGSFYLRSPNFHAKVAP